MNGYPQLELLYARLGYRFNFDEKIKKRLEFLKNSITEEGYLKSDLNKYICTFTGVGISSTYLNFGESCDIS
jgi:hypothetical protein